MASEMDTTTQITLFRDKEIRKTLHQGEWFFVVQDVVTALTDSAQPAGYIKDMRRRDPELNQGWGQNTTPLSVRTPEGPQNLNPSNYLLKHLPEGA